MTHELFQNWFIQYGLKPQKSRQSGSLWAHYFMNQNFPGHAVFAGSSEKDPAFRILNQFPQKISSFLAKN